MAALTPEVLLVFALVTVVLVLFATEPVPVDITALGLMVALMVAGPLSQQLSAVGLLGGPVELLPDSPADGLAGFASTATITVLAMFILSDGVQRTGIVQILGRKLAALTGDSETRQLGATMGVVAPLSGFINNTAAVAILLPMVTDIAHEGNTSPSKLLIPLSYASMFGGTLTLIGTSTNILASEVAADVANDVADPSPAVVALQDGFSMFEFTSLGLIVTVVGFVYFLVVGRYLLPSRIEPEDDLAAEFRLSEYLTEVVVREDSPLVGQTVRDALAETEFDVDLVQLIRDDEVFLEPLGPKTIQAGDLFTVRTDRETLVELLDVEGMDVVPEFEVTEDELERADPAAENLVEIVVAPGSHVVGESIASVNFRQRYDATVLALRRGGELIRKRMDHIVLQVGDTLLVQGTADSIQRLDDNRDFIVAQEIERHDYREEKIPVAIGVILAVVGLAAVDLLPIVVSALGGAVAMVLTGCLKPGEVYDAVQWDVIVLLAGVIPLGTAMQHTGAALYLADLLVATEPYLPAIAVLGLFYVLTAALTNVVSNNASVVLMIPVAFDTAAKLDASPYAFVLAVTFAASTAFMTPVGYQTNLFVYGPGGYKFTDYTVVGTPLQLVFAVVTTLGIAVLWPL
ncbi:SLC13 family permease [Haloarchaeobius iranensis]|uniref:Di-and tricarboxylate transporter n=1 Tax=Haloarchaeobius iranensis TaxID=996166 RepID=A0A1G9SIG1_9EURY|nr:SLC13 family permease [Haloarchaeobius iranensis]SDM35288.1 Di-and tricarboxylate transporter [Haloarchaeobius iranensis]